MKEEKSMKKKSILLISVAILLAAAVVVTLFLTGVFGGREQTEDPTVSAVSGTASKTAKEPPKEDLSATYREQWARVKDLRVGSTVLFGLYEQDNRPENGREEILWRVLDIQGDKVLVVCEYLLDAVPYNKEYVDVTWETCSLRKWLNEDFLNSAFGKEHQSRIMSTNVVPDRNATRNTDPGKATVDRMFVLSQTEIETYFTVRSPQTLATVYALTRGAGDTTENGNAFWTRTTGFLASTATVIMPSGLPYPYGYVVDFSACSARPAMWISLT